MIRCSAFRKSSLVMTKWGFCILSRILLMNVKHSVVILVSFNFLDDSMNLKQMAVIRANRLKLAYLSKISCKSSVVATTNVDKYLVFRSRVGSGITNSCSQVVFSSRKMSGPFHHKLWCSNSDGLMPLEAQSAGLFFPST